MAQFAPRCDLCDRPMERWVVTATGKTCKKCFQSAVECFSCKTLIAPSIKPVDLSDGRKVCASCHSTSIDSPQDAASLLSDIKTILHTHGLESLHSGSVFDNLEIQILDRHSLQNTGLSNSKCPLGMTLTRKRIERRELRNHNSNPVKAPCLEPKAPQCSNPQLGSPSYNCPGSLEPEPDQTRLFSFFSKNGELGICYAAASCCFRV